MGTDVDLVHDTLPERALRYLGLHPDNPATWVLAALAQRYQLDPLLNEVAVINTKQGARPYVTRDGLLTVAHRSGVFDGMTTDELREGEHGWAATVTVWRKDMSHGFTYSAGCGRQEPQAQQGHGPEMALARAERRALRRAFNIPSGQGGDWDDLDLATAPDGPGAVSEQGSGREEVPPSPGPGPTTDTVPTMTEGQANEIRGLFSALGMGADRTEVRAYVTAVLGQEVTNTGTLTRDEAERVAYQLRADVDAMRARDAEPEPEPEPEGEPDGV